MFLQLYLLLLLLMALLSENVGFAPPPMAIMAGIGPNRQVVHRKALKIRNICS